MKFRLQKTFPQKDFPLLSREWRWRQFALCHLAAVLLIISFLPGSPLRGMWDAIDAWGFYALNGSVAGGGIWAEAAAFANTKLFDFISTAILVLLLLSYGFFGRQGDFAWRMSGVVFLGLYMLILVYGRRKLGIGEFDRLSPSLVLEPFFDLDAMFEDMRVKTRAGSSFPGDHANACMVFVPLLWMLGRKYWGLAALALAPFFMMPRLIGGAHWLSDALVGGTVFALLIVSWAVYTPLFVKGTSALHVPAMWKLRILEKCWNAVFRRAEKKSG